jgi:hypothetical protein
MQTDSQATDKNIIVAEREKHSELEQDKQSDERQEEEQDGRHSRFFQRVLAFIYLHQAHLPNELRT